jgi:hypothetical protein
VSVKDDAGKWLAGAAVTATPWGGSAQSATSNALGAAHFDVPAGVPIAIAVRLAGYSNLDFSRKISSPDDWGTATVTMMKPRLGNSRVSEWRTGRSAAGEDPAKDNARFDFYVKYYRDGSAINGASIVLTKLDGSVFKSLTSDSKGYASCLVPETMYVNVAVTASGYANYNTALWPDKHATQRTVNVRLRKQ